MEGWGDWGGGPLQEVEVLGYWGGGPLQEVEVLGYWGGGPLHPGVGHPLYLGRRGPGEAVPHMVGGSRAPSFIG